MRSPRKNSKRLHCIQAQFQAASACKRTRDAGSIVGCFDKPRIFASAQLLGGVIWKRFWSCDRLWLQTWTQACAHRFSASSIGV